MTEEHRKLLEVLVSGDIPSKEDFKSLIQTLDNLMLVNKRFVLEGTPYVFKDAPMKYLVFKEQIAENFEIGSQAVCIVGSARLGYSISPEKFGTDFSQNSDVDVVVVSESYFHKGTKRLFRYFNSLTPTTREVDRYLKNPAQAKNIDSKKLSENWIKIKHGIRNYAYDNFNPVTLPDGDDLRNEIFEKASSTSDIFLALSPQVFVNKIRVRIFKDWLAAENYYHNTLIQAKRELQNAGKGQQEPLEPIADEDT